MYAAELNALHLQRQVAWVHHYNYKGPKEKIRSGLLSHIRHNPENTIIHIKDSAGYTDRFYLTFDTEIIIKEVE